MLLSSLTPGSTQGTVLSSKRTRSLPDVTTLGAWLRCSPGPVLATTGWLHEGRS